MFEEFVAKGSASLTKMKAKFRDWEDQLGYIVIDCLCCRTPETYGRGLPHDGHGTIPTLSD
jgi:hypothetical protein